MDSLFTKYYNLSLCEQDDLQITTSHSINGKHNKECYITTISFSNGIPTMTLNSPTSSNILQSIIKLLGWEQTESYGNLPFLEQLNTLSMHIKKNSDVALIMNTYVHLCCDFPYFQMYAMDFYLYFHAMLKELDYIKEEESILSKIERLICNLSVINKYIFEAIIYQNHFTTKIDVKTQLLEYESFRLSHNETCYYLLWLSEFKQINKHYPDDMIASYINCNTTKKRIHSDYYLSSENRLRIKDGQKIEYFTDNLTTRNTLLVSLDNLAYEKLVTDDTTFEKTFIAFVNYLANTERTIVRCISCKRHYITTLKSSSNLCRLPNSLTQSNCQEQGATMRYKASQNENIITKTYTTYYNRLYARVKRGTLSAESAPFDEMRRLRDSYLDLYKQAIDKEALLREFIEKLELLTKK